MYVCISFQDYSSQGFSFYAYIEQNLMVMQTVPFSGGRGSQQSFPPKKPKPKHTLKKSQKLEQSPKSEKQDFF